MELKLTSLNTEDEMRDAFQGLNRAPAKNPRTWDFSTSLSNFYGGSVKLVRAFLSWEEMVDLMWHWVVDLELFPPSVRGVILGRGGGKWAVLQMGHPSSLRFSRLIFKV